MYRESVTWPLWFHLLFGALVAVCVVAAVRSISKADAAIHVPAMAGGAALFGFVWWRFRRIDLETGPEGVAFGFGGLNRRVPRGRIESVEVEDYSFARYMGWGYRVGWGRGDRAYSVIGYRRGLRIVFVDERDRPWRIFVSCADPDAARKAFVGDQA